MTDEWAVPDTVFRPVEAAYGPFTLDAAATMATARAGRFWTIEDDGLRRPWDGRVWCNPPYSRIGPWIAKAAAETAGGRVRAVVLLVPASTGSRWWGAAAAGGFFPVFWPGRIRFGDGPGRAFFDSALLTWGVRRLVAVRCVICNAVFLARRGARTCSARCRMALSRRGPRD